MRIPGFDWPILYVRVLWMSLEPDGGGFYATRILVLHHGTTVHDGDKAWLYEAAKGGRGRSLLVQFQQGRVTDVRCVRLTR